MGQRKYPVELRERAVRLYRESDPKPVVRRLAEQLNVHPELSWKAVSRIAAAAGTEVPEAAMGIVGGVYYLVHSLRSSLRSPQARAAAAALKERTSR